MLLTVVGSIPGANIYSGIINLILDNHYIMKMVSLMELLRMEKLP